MSRLVSTGWASALLGLAFSGAAFAQTAPADDHKMPNDGAMPQEDTSAEVLDEEQPMTSPDAQAQSEPTDVDVNVYTPPPPPPETYVAPTYAVEEEEGWSPMSGIGVSLAAGGGVSGFTDDTMRNTTDPGGDWDVRLTLGTRSPIAFEGSYIGSAQNISALGLDNDAVLVGNGVQGALRVNATTDYFVQPFAFGGAAWRRYDLTNADFNGSDVAGSDNVLEIPVGLGIAGRTGGFILDARGEYRFSTDEDLIPSQNRIASFAEMNRWGVKATVGVEF